jgi:hypothetical protein
MSNTKADTKLGLGSFWVKTIGVIQNYVTSLINDDKIR